MLYKFRYIFIEFSWIVPEFSKASIEGTKNLEMSRQKLELRNEIWVWTYINIINSYINSFVNSCMNSFVNKRKNYI